MNFETNVEHTLFFYIVNLDTRAFRVGTRRNIDRFEQKFIAFCKTSLTKKFSFDILPVAYLTILMLDSLLNDCGTSVGSRMEIRLAAAVLRGVHDRLH